MARPSRGAVALVAAILLVIPVLVSLVPGLWGAHWFASSDQALQVLRIHDVGTGHTPLVGVASRFGWSHPGPFQFWLLAPFYRLLGETGILVGTALLNLLALVGAIWVAHRRGGRALALGVALGEALLIRALGLTLLLDPWNPWVAVLPFVVFVLCSWSLCLGDLWIAPVMAVTGTFVIQAHVSYIPLVVAAIVLVSVYRSARWIRIRRRAPPRSQRRRSWLPYVVAAGITFALWLPPIIEQVISGEGNLSALVSYFRHPAEASIGWTGAVGVLGRELTPVSSPWVAGHDTNAFGFVGTAGVLPALLVLGVVAVLAIAAWRRGHTDPAALAVVALVGDAVGTVAIARVTGALGTYLIRWWWPMAMLTYLAGGWCALALVAPTVRRLRQPLALGVLAAILGVATTASVQDFPARLPQAQASVTTGELTRQLVAVLSPTHRYRLQNVDGLTLGSVGTGVLVSLRLRGLQVLGSPDQDLALGSWRTLPTDDPAPALIVVNHEDELAGWRPPSTAKLVAHFDPLTPTERLDASRVETRIRAAIGSRAPRGPIDAGVEFGRGVLVAEGASRGDVDKLAKLQAKGQAFDIYLRP